MVYHSGALMTRPPLKEMADYLAKHGRQGDDVIVHMSKAEVQGLGALHPRGRLSVNPATGQPEAFDILGALAGLAGGVGGFVVGGPMGAAVGSGLATTAYTGNIGKGLAAGLIGYGLGAGAGLLAEGAGSAAGAAVEAATATGPTALASAAPGFSAGADGVITAPINDIVAQSAGSAPMTAGPFTQETATAMAAYPGTTPAPGVFDRLGSHLKGNWDTLGKAASNVTNPDALGKAFWDNALTTTFPIASGAYGLATSGFGMEGGGGYQPPQQQQSVNYPTLRSGGTGAKYTPQTPDPYGKEKTYFTPTYWQKPYAGGGGVGREEGGLSDVRRAWEMERDPDHDGQDSWLEVDEKGNRTMSPAWAERDLANYDAELADRLRQERYMTPSQRPNPEMRFDRGGEVSDYKAEVSDKAMDTANRREKRWRQYNMGDPMEGWDTSAPQFYRRDYRSPQSEYYGLGRYKKGEGPEPNDVDLPSHVSPLIYVVPGQKYAMGGPVSGPGGGLDDAIPAIVDRRSPAALSSGEYVIPAHAVSGLGNGSTEDGVRQLDGMVTKVMKNKYGTANRKPRPLNPRKMMPMGVANRGGSPFEGYAGGGILGWAKEKMGYGEKPLDPKRSWDMDPLPTEYPTADDAREARLYNVRHGNPNEYMINNETKMSMIPNDRVVSSLNSRVAFTDPPPKTRLGWDEADKMYRTQVASNVAPASAIGFDPSRISYTPAAELTVGGMYSRRADRSWVDSDYPAAGPHEAMHRGYRMVENDPEGLAATKKFEKEYPYEFDERIVRAGMQKYFGPDVEMTELVRKYGPDGPGWKQSERGKKDLADPKFRKHLRDLDRIAHRKNSEKVIEKAGGVYARGGKVIPYGR